MSRRRNFLGFVENPSNGQASPWTTTSRTTRWRCHAPSGRHSLRAISSSPGPARMGRAAAAAAPDKSSVRRGRAMADPSRVRWPWWRNLEASEPSNRLATRRRRKCRWEVRMTWRFDLLHTYFFQMHMVTWLSREHGIKLTIKIDVKLCARI